MINPSAGSQPSEHLNWSDNAASLCLFSEAVAEKQAVIDEFDNDGLTTESEDEADSLTTIIVQFFEEGGLEAFYQMHNFIPTKSDQL